MTVKFRCPNGHKLRFDAKDSGKKAACPTCHAKFLLPTLKPRVSDTSIMAVLGDHPPDRSVIAHPSATVPTGASSKMCPKCKARIGSRYQICRIAALIFPSRGIRNLEPPGLLMPIVMNNPRTGEWHGG